MIALPGLNDARNFLNDARKLGRTGSDPAINRKAEHNLLESLSDQAVPISPSGSGERIEGVVF